MCNERRRNGERERERERQGVVEDSLRQGEGKEGIKNHVLPPSYSYSSIQACRIHLYPSPLLCSSTRYVPTPRLHNKKCFIASMTYLDPPPPPVMGRAGGSIFFGVSFVTATMVGSTHTEREIEGGRGRLLLSCKCAERRPNLDRRRSSSSSSSYSSPTICADDGDDDGGGSASLNATPQ